MASAQSTVDSLKELNSRLIAEIDKLRKENANIKSENIKLKQDKEESDEEKTDLIAKLERNVSLIKGLSLQDKGTECYQTVANVSQVPITVSPEINSNHTPKQMVSRNEDALASDISDNASKSDLHRPICVESKTSEDKKVDEFLSSVNKKRISNEIRERKRKEKLQDQESFSTPENTANISHKQSIKSQISTSHSKNVSISEAEKMPSNHNEGSNTTDARLSPEIRDISSKIPYNQKVEQGLIHELFEFIRGTDFMSLQNLKKTPLKSIFIKQISDIPVDIDLPPGSMRKYHSSSEFQKLISMKNSSQAHDQLKSDIKTKVCEETLLETEIKAEVSILQVNTSSHLVIVFGKNNHVNFRRK
ncbi:4630_t:CDS:2, partial [Ambispora gerdemannii]